MPDIGVERLTGMNRKVAWRLLGLVVGIAVLAVVAVVAYNYGVNAGHNGTQPIFTQPIFGRVGGVGRMGGFGVGFGLLGLVPALVFGLLIVGLFVVLFTAPGRPAPSSHQDAPGAGVDGLRELSEMHGSGHLTDEEFATAKKRLLGL
jgi:uncharacterized membrane protein